MEYISLFDNIMTIKKYGMDMIWIEFKTIYDTKKFLELCIKNNVNFIPGNKCTIYNNSFMNCILINIAYYDKMTLITGLERIIDSITKYNSINVKTYGDNIFISNEINYIGKITKFNYAFDGMMPLNSVIIYNIENTELVEYMLVNKLYLPLLITTEIKSNYILEYSKHAPVSYITDISIDMIYWILTKQKGIHIYDSTYIDNIFLKEDYDNIKLYDININVHPQVISYIINKVKHDKCIVMSLYKKKKVFEIKLYDNNVEVLYCLESLRTLVNYINDTYNCSNGIIQINNTKYIFNDNIELPKVEYNNDSTYDINSIISQMTNLMVEGISFYNYINNKYLLVDIDDDIIQLDMLDTISSLINNNNTIIYLNSNTNTVRVFDRNNIEIIYEVYILSCILEYYKYNKLLNNTHIYINHNNKKIKLNIENKINMI